MRVLAVVSLVLFLLAQPAVSQVPDHYLIVPGQRIGRWTLEMTIDQLVMMNGHPSLVDRVGAADQLPPAPVGYNWDRYGFAAITRDGQKVEFFLLYPHAFMTDKNIGPGSTRASIQGAYGTPTAETTVNAEGRTRMIYDALGFAAVIDGGVANAVNVFRAGTAKTIWKF